MGVLQEILVGVREDLAARKAALPEAELEAMARDVAPRPSLVAALQVGEGPRILAEVKRSSTCWDLHAAQKCAVECDPDSVGWGWYNFLGGDPYWCLASSQTLTTPQAPTRILTLNQVPGDVREVLRRVPRHW